MANRHYDDDFKLRVVAIASVRGLSAACKQFNLNHETVRAWQAERPDDDRLKLAADLALSELTVEIAEQKNRGKLSTHAGILMDKVSRYYRPKAPEEPRDAVEEWGDVLEAKLDKLYGEDADLAFMVLVYALEDGDGASAQGVLADPIGYLASLGDLEEWRMRRVADAHERMVVQLAKNERSKQAAMTAALDAETQALVAAAEAWLEAANDAA